MPDPSLTTIDDILRQFKIVEEAGMVPLFPEWRSLTEQPDDVPSFPVCYPLMPTFVERPITSAGTDPINPTYKTWEVWRIWSIDRLLMVGDVEGNTYGKLSKRADKYGEPYVNLWDSLEGRSLNSYVNFIELLDPRQGQYPNPGGLWWGWYFPFNVWLKITKRAPQY